jgi:cytochrome c-type biogenesis protein CcmF
MDIQYIGEHLWFGKLGQALTVLAFVSAALASLSYFYSTREALPVNPWRKLARLSFGIHSFSVISIFGLLFYLIYNHYFEYYYVWHHSSTLLPVQYIFACFWEGQEGSFLLWMFWHIVLSWFVIRKGGEWEAPVLSVVAIVQVFLASMVLGVYVFGYRIGSDPFILLRDDPEMAKLPFVSMPDYLSRITDGRGLNPLLQNYWMVIHPPTLFLGFAATLFPFAYAVAGLWRRKTSEWVKPALPWTFFGIMILGTGILMGAAWAYESLTFGGFWAWDPVENASLVPWITFVAAGHLMLIYKHKKTALFTTLILTLATFLLILYSTFLTRSGILGDTSVHAFTDLGMSGQLLFYMGFFVVLAVWLLIANRKAIPLSGDEESMSSREFWMFIGTLVLIISSFQITFSTSIPVINKLFGVNLAPPTDVKDHYNKWQLPLAVVLALLIGATQFFKYRQTDIRTFFRNILPALLISTALTALAAWQLGMYNVHYLLLMWASLFAITGNLDFLLRIAKGKIRHSGSSIAHIGFGMILLGVLISTAESKVISRNHSNIDLGKELPNHENIMLMKGDTLGMGEYYLSYKGKRKEGVNVFFEIEYFRLGNDGKLQKEFTLFPVIQTNPRMGNVSEPDTRHYLTRDVYTHITYADAEDLKEENPGGGYKEPVTSTVAEGDTLTTGNSLIIFRSLNKNVDRQKHGLAMTDLAVGAELELMDINKRKYTAEPLFVIRENTIFPVKASVEELGLRITFSKINPDNGKVDLTIEEKKENTKEFIVMKAIVFPYINILWTGCILMVLGTLIAIRKRLANG